MSAKNCGGHFTFPRELPFRHKKLASPLPPYFAQSITIVVSLSALLDTVQFEDSVRCLTIRLPGCFY